MRINLGRMRQPNQYNPRFHLFPPGLLLLLLTNLLINLPSQSDLMLPSQKGKGSRKGRMWWMLASLVLLVRRMSSELQSSKKPVTRLSEAERSDTQLSEPQIWLPAPMHNGEPLRDDASIRDFNSGVGCHVALVLEEALLLPRDMAEIKNARKNELILNNKR